MIRGIISSCLLIIAIIFIRKISEGHVKKTIQYSLWLIVALKLLVFPVPWVTSPVAIFSANDKNVSTANEKPADSMHEDINISKISVDDKEITESSNWADIALDANENSMVDNADSTNLTVQKSSINLSKVLMIVFIAIWVIGIIIIAVKFIAQNYILRKMLSENSVKYKQKDVPLDVYVVDDLATPCLYNRKIYTSEKLLKNPEQRKHILAHEYCHYKHGDGFWSVIRCICLVVYWWNPLVWLAVRMSKTDCELACDEDVLKILGDEERINYGKTLLSLIPSKGNKFFLVASTMEGSKHSMKDRIKFIANKTKVRSSICIAVSLVSILLLACSCTVKPDKSVSSTTKEETMELNDSTSESNNDSQADNQVDNQTNNQVDNQTNNQVDNQADNKTDNQADSQTDNQADSQANSQADNQADNTDNRQNAVADPAEEANNPTGNDYSVCTDLPATEVESYAKKVSQIFANRNWDELSNNIMYPITVNGKEYDNKESFDAEDWDTVFTNEFIESISDLKAEELWANWQGICLSNGLVWLNTDSTGNLKISTIN